MSEVAVSGTIVTCLVSGSFQPLLECLLGYEVLHLRSTAADLGEVRSRPIGPSAG